MLRTITACLIAWLIASAITAATSEPDFTDTGVGCTFDCLDT